jgi:predicted small secreted protein
MAKTHGSDDVQSMNKKHLSVILVTALLTLLSSGCRTMEGAGEDIEEAGQEIQESAR